MPAASFQHPNALRAHPDVVSVALSQAMVPESPLLFLTTGPGSMALSLPAAAPLTQLGPIPARTSASLPRTHKSCPWAGRPRSSTLWCQCPTEGGDLPEHSMGHRFLPRSHQLLL